MTDPSATTGAPSVPLAPATNAGPRSIEGIYAPPAPHWVGDGFRVHGMFNVIDDAFAKVSPFLMLDYHAPYSYAPREEPRGVGVHPHRGIETVSLAWEGSVAHHDSAGHSGVIGPGDVQWMTAGGGILHKEYHEQEFSRRGGRVHFAQLWVNLPKRHKMTAPTYQPLLKRDMGVVELPNSMGSVRVIAGSHAGVRGPARTFTPLNVLDVTLEAGGKVDLILPARDNAMVLTMTGTTKLNDSPVPEARLVLFHHDGDRVTLEATTRAHLLVLSGEPIDEPVVAYGPFVMNTEDEIAAAFKDLRMGKFGFLED